MIFGATHINHRAVEVQAPIVIGVGEELAPSTHGPVVYHAVLFI
jgi:hypothetical protein